MYNMNDYRAALAARDEKELFSEEWNVGQAKVQAIVAVMIATGNKEMVEEIRDELYNMNDSGVSFSDHAVQFDLWLLESNGYAKVAEKIKDLEW